MDNILITWYIKFQSLTFSKTASQIHFYRNYYNLEPRFNKCPSFPQNKLLKVQYKSFRYKGTA